MQNVRCALILAALATLPPLASGLAETGSVAYPKNPSGTPAANDGGKSIETDPSCSVAACRDKPASPGGHSGDAAGSDQTTGIKPPATAYPHGPVDTPTATSEGKAPR
jgi:hypothetical protein